MRALLSGTLLLAAACGDAGTELPDESSGSSPSPVERSSLDAPLETPVPGDRGEATQWWAAARQQLELGQMDQAERLYEKALSVDPSFRELRVSFGVVLFEESTIKNPGRAVTLFREGRLLEPDAMDLVAGEGVARAMVGDAGGARPLLERAVGAELFPRLRAWVQTMLGEILYQEGRMEEADPLLEAAAGTAEREPVGRSKNLVRRAEIADARGDTDAAMALLEEALVADPESLAGHFLLSRLCLRLERHERAAKHERIHELLRRMMDHNSSIFVNDHEQRIQLATELVEVFPEHRGARLRLIRELLEMRRYDTALAHAEAHGALDLDVREQGRLLNLTARAHAGRGDLEAAKRDSLAMRDLVPEVPVAVVRAVLEEWGWNDPEVTAERRDEVAREWLAPDG